MTTALTFENLYQLNGIEKLTNLVVLYMSNNLVAKWTEFDKFKETTKVQYVCVVAEVVVVIE